MTEVRKVLVAGAGGVIGGALVSRVLDEGMIVRAVDVKPLDDWYKQLDQAENLQLDLSLKPACDEVAQGIDDVYNLAADMGGMGFIENNKALCMLSVLINTHLIMASKEA